MKKSPPKKQKGLKTQTLKMAKSKKRKLAGGKEQRAGNIIIEEPAIEYIDIEESTSIENNKPVAKGTTTVHLYNSSKRFLISWTWTKVLWVVIL